MDARVNRLLDANVNRAREGLRVIEDYARFMLDDAAVALSVKQIRHELAAIAALLGVMDLLAHRDVAGDLGREAKTAAELVRCTPDDVASASLARVGEALRSISEFAKLHSTDAAIAAERLRYRLYDVEPRIRLRSRPASRFRQARLYVIVTESLCTLPWLDTAAAALRGGAAVLQLREKSLSDGELLRRARSLRSLTREHNAQFIMNDRADIARLADADGLHVGQDDLSISEARRIGGGAMLLGVSTHTHSQIEAAAAASPDYIAVGPMFPTATKPQTHIAGPAALHFARNLTSLPLVAIGGITDENAIGIVEAGADVICVCSAVIAAEDPQSAARRIIAALPVAKSEPPPAAAEES